MKFLQLITAIAAALQAGSIATAQPLAGVQADTTPSPESDHHLLARAWEDKLGTGPKPSARILQNAYRQASAAAGGALNPDAYYYFMNCVNDGKAYEATTPRGREIYAAHRCTHVGLIIGKTDAAGREFVASYLHVYLKKPKGWIQAMHYWEPRDKQSLVYGGQLGSQPDVDYLRAAGERWLYGAPFKITERYNCAAHYDYLVSLL